LSDLIRVETSSNPFIHEDLTLVIDIISVGRTIWKFTLVFSQNHALIFTFIHLIFVFFIFKIIISLLSCRTPLWHFDKGFFSTKVQAILSRVVSSDQFRSLRTRK